MTPIRMIEGADLPDVALTLEDRDGNTLDLSSGWTFTVKVGPEAGAATFTKTDGITGDDTAPNVVISWETDEVGDLAAGRYVLELTCRQGDTRERKYKLPLVIEPALGEVA